MISQLGGRGSHKTPSISKKISQKATFVNTTILQGGNKMEHILAVIGIIIIIAAVIKLIIAIRRKEK